MTDAPAKSPVTTEDILNLPEDAWIEVVDGEMIRIDMSVASYLHVIVIDHMYDILKPHVKAKRLGRVHTDGLTYILGNDESGAPIIRIPDLSFVRRERIPPRHQWSKPFPGAPDLAVEVTSPNQDVEDIQRRIQDYLDAGSEQVWVIHAKTQELYQYHREDRSIIRVYRHHDQVDCGTLFPGLKFAIGELFEDEEI